MSPRKLWPLCVVLAWGCKHLPDEKARQGAQIHYDLGIQAQQAGDYQNAYREFQSASELDPYLPEAQNALGILLHLAFHKPDEAIAHYKQALETRPEFSEVKVNLANVYLSEDKFDQAIPLYEAALNDMLYATPYIAQNNLGWALFKTGKVVEGRDAIKAAVTTNPKFCQGFRNLALINESEHKDRDACREWKRFGDACPEAGEPMYRQAMCLVHDGDLEGARKAFANCVSRAKEERVQEDCRAQLDQMTPTPGRPR